MYISSVIIKTKQMKTILKNENLLVLLATVAVIAGGVFLIPMLVAVACKALLFIFTKPLTAGAIAVAFLVGMFVNEKLK